MPIAALALTSLLAAPRRQRQPLVWMRFS